MRDPKVPSKGQPDCGGSKETEKPFCIENRGTPMIKINVQAYPLNFRRTLGTYLQVGSKRCVFHVFLIVMSLPKTLGDV